MGPQLVRCGKAARNADNIYQDVMLQWGRNLFVAERMVYANAFLYKNAASMGPQLVRCGKSKNGEKTGEKGGASMGPQLVRCGKRGTASFPWHCRDASMGPQLVRCGKADLLLQHLAGFAVLQWGRNLFVAESSPLWVLSILSL